MRGAKPDTTKKGSIFSVTLYEYPFSERIRAYLRVEYLFDRLFFFARQADAHQHQIAVSTLFDILEASERADTKNAVLHDLERQRQTLTGLRDHPSVAQNALQTTLGDMEKVLSALSAQGKTGQTLRENEWLASLRGRLAVSGGAMQVDMPSYHAWQHKPEALRRADLQNWIAPLLPVHKALTLVLRLLRESGSKSEVVAEQGAYKKMLGGKLFHLLRVWVDAKQEVFPEISVNKYMVWIRFSNQEGKAKPQHVTRDVSFHMSLCNA
jgi:cell division protein ZapD